MCHSAVFGTTPSMNLLKCPTGRVLRPARPIKHGRFFYSKARDCARCPWRVKRRFSSAIITPLCSALAVVVIAGPQKTNASIDGIGGARRLRAGRGKLLQRPHDTLLVVGGRADRIPKASMRTEARGPLEAGRDGVPEATTDPLESVALAVKPQLLRAMAELPLNSALAGRSAQVNQCRVRARLR